MYAKLLITNKSKENNVPYIFCVADNYQKVVETHHTVSPSFIDSILTQMLFNVVLLNLDGYGS